jgi:rhomboid protease GluP
MSPGAPIPEPRLGPSTQGAPVPVRAAAEPETAEPPFVSTYPLTTAIIVVNILVFIGQLWASGAVGLAGMPSSVLLAFGGNYVNATLVDRYETLLTSCFVHGSALHIGFNMIALRQIGPFIERSVGAARMAPLYLISGIAGSIGSTFFGWLSQGQRLSVGASGAICGLIGAALVIGYRIEGAKSPLMRAMARWLLTLFALGLVVSFFARRGGFDNAAHVAGSVAGASVAAAWRRGVVFPRSTTIAVVLLCASIVAGAGLRCARFTLKDPFATMLIDERVAAATHAIDLGDCPTAHDALDSVVKLAPRAPEVALLQRNYHHRCRP